jgi:hypothetical protein
VFETNSSSSHSLVIEKVTDNDIVIKDGVINIDDLENFSLSLNDDEGSIIICDTVNKKLALAFAMMIDDYNYFATNHLVEDEFDSLKEKYDIIKVNGEFSIYDDYLDAEDVIGIIDDPSSIVKYVHTNY